MVWVMTTGTGKRQANSTGTGPGTPTPPHGASPHVRTNEPGKGGHGRGRASRGGPLAKITLTLPERMVIVRRRLGMSQRQLADLLSVSEFTICRNERGTRKGTGQWTGDVRHRWALVEARYKLEIERGNEVKGNRGGSPAMKKLQRQITGLGPIAEVYPGK